VVSLISKDNPNTGSSSICCKEALEILDLSNWQTDPRSAELTNHLATCSECAAAARVEDALRSVIAPSELPSVSTDFEANLMAELGIQPQIAKLPKPFVNPISRWGWIATMLTVTALLFNQIVYVAMAIPAFGMMVYAKIAALFAGKTALAFTSYFGYMPKIAGSGDAFAMHIALGIIVLVAAISAIRWSTNR